MPQARPDLKSHLAEDGAFKPRRRVDVKAWFSFCQTGQWLLPAFLDILKCVISTSLGWEC